MSALSDPKNVLLIPIEDTHSRGTKLTAAMNDEMYDDDDKMEDAADEQVDEDELAAADHLGMIALIPSVADVDRISAVATESSTELHLTLFFLGEAEDYSPATRMSIVQAVQELCSTQSAITANVFGAALWNPDVDPCVVLSVSGPTLPEVQESIGEALEDIWSAQLPEQHCPWIPHITLAYGNDAGVIARAASLVGPITFDRVRIAFAEDVTDVPLYGGSMLASTEVALATDSPSASGEGNPVGRTPPPQGADQMAMTSSGTPWQGVLVIEGIETGDGRLFSAGSLTWAQPPIPLRWAPADNGEHQGAVVVARMDEIWRDPVNPNQIRARGVFDDQGVNGAEALRLVNGGFLKGVSVDVDSIKDADVELIFPEGSDGQSGDDMASLFAMPELMVFHAGQIRAATLVDIPAFVDAQIWTDNSMPLATAAPTASGEGMPMMQSAANQLFAHNCGDNVNITACAVGVNAVLRDARLNLNMAQRRDIYDHLAEHLQAAGLTPLPFGETTFSDEVAALVAGLVPVDEHAPPAAWFEDPHLAGPTPLTITDDGRIFGHGALWASCHTGYADACVTPPREGDHVYYRQGELLTVEGTRVAVGHITLGTGHAPTFGSDPHKAVEHYDNTGSVVADVVSGEDAYGIWVSGAIRPGLSAARVRELRSAQLSGDWRRIGGKLRLVAFLAVNVPGFPVPRLATDVREGRQVSLVAAGMVPQNADVQYEDRVALRTLRDKLQRRMHRTPAERAAALRARVLGGK